MPLLVPTSGENKLLAVMLGKEAVPAATLMLYVNDKTPADADTAASYTEMSTHGYAAKSIDLTTAVINQNNGVAEAVYAQQSWTFTAAAPVTVYGYVVKTTGDNTVLWSERFATPRVVQYDGDQIRLILKLTLSKTP